MINIVFHCPTSYSNWGLAQRWRSNEWKNDSIASGSIMDMLLWKLDEYKYFLCLFLARNKEARNFVTYANDCEELIQCFSVNTTCAPLKKTSHFFINVPLKVPSLCTHHLISFVCRQYSLYAMRTLTRDLKPIIWRFLSNARFAIDPLVEVSMSVANWYPLAKTSFVHWYIWCVDLSSLKLKASSGGLK